VAQAAGHRRDLLRGLHFILVVNLFEKFAEGAWLT